MRIRRPEPAAPDAGGVPAEPVPAQEAPEARPSSHRAGSPTSVRGAIATGWRRVLVVGSAGAGKTTFAVRLAPLLGLPLVHLDAEFWRPGWRQTPPEAWRWRVDALVTRDAWVMDGNYGGTLERRLARADAVVFLDVPRHVCMRRVILRIWRNRGRPGPGLPEGCPERWDWRFLVWVWNFERRSRERLVGLLAASGLPVVRLTTGREASRWLRT